MRARTTPARRSIASSGWHRRRADGDGEESFVLQQTRGRERVVFIADHHRHDRALRVGQAGKLREGARLLHRQRGVIRLALDHLERRDAGGDDRGRQTGRVDQRARAVAHEFDHRA
jgi:hypothetical protein